MLLTFAASTMKPSDVRNVGAIPRLVGQAILAMGVLATSVVAWASFGHVRGRRD